MSSQTLFKGEIMIAMRPLIHASASLVLALASGLASAQPFTPVIDEF